MKAHLLLCGACVGLLLASAAVAQSPPQYRMTILPEPEDAFVTRPRALNDHGEVTGDIGFGGIELLSLTVYWSTPETAPQVMTGEGSEVALASDINNDGIVVGSASEGLIAFTWQPGSDLVSLDDPIGCCAFANAINDAGTVVGNSSMTGALASQWHDGVITSLPSLDGGCCTVAHDLNEHNQVVGASNGSAVMWDGDDVIEIGDLGGLFAIAYGVNESGEVVGTAQQEPSSFSRPFYWNGGEIMELPLLAGGSYGEAKAINDQGAIVGMSTVPLVPGEVSARATMWLGGEPFDLNELTVNGPEDALMTHATDINAGGQIVGYVDIGFETHGFFLDPLSAADFDGDGSVGAADLALLLGSWGPCVECAADLDDDGTVNAADLAILLGMWG